MSVGLEVGLIMGGGLLAAVIGGYLLAYAIIGHNPLHRGRCMDQPAEIRRAERRKKRND